MKGSPYGVEAWNKATLKSLLVPGAVLLAMAMLVLRSGMFTLPASAIAFYYYAAFLAGILLAWRFHSSRVMFALVVLFLGHRAIEFFVVGLTLRSGPGRIALEAVAVLLPLNFALLSFLRERGVTFSTLPSRLALLLVESVFVAVICRPEETTAPGFLLVSFFPESWFHWTIIPQLAWLAFLVTAGILLVRFLLYRKPVESGLLWSLMAAFLGLQAGAVGPTARGYIASAAIILAGSIIENSYVLAYHDELTALPGRRAFNEALLRLQSPYTVAVVDIDHFKNFNDTYGHETGDQVLCMVAARLAHVTGGGEAFRVGGEEFCILFPEKSANDVMEHLELLRSLIEATSFQVRGGQDRRSTSHGPDRRRAPRKRMVPMRPAKHPRREEISVTVSMGVAEPTTRTNNVEQVVRAADKALYRAKEAGRNRVENASAIRPRTPKRSIA